MYYSTSTMIELLRNQLPSGLAAINLEFAATQKAEYPYVCRTKTVKSPVASCTPSSHHQKRHYPCIFEQLLKYVDDMYDIYNAQMRAEGKSRFMNRVKEFVGCMPGTALVGRKASREIMSYISNKPPRRDVTPPESFFKLCSFLLDARVHVGNNTYEWPGIKTDKDIHLKN